SGSNDCEKSNGGFPRTDWPAARFWTAPVLWRFSILPAAATAAEDCRTPRRYRAGGPPGRCIRASSFLRPSTFDIRHSAPPLMSDPSASRVPAWLHPLLWPVIALAALLLFNLLFTEGFAHIAIKDAHFYGSLVDVLKQASRVMLVSLGMTLIIATGGVDLSVGAVIAIAGSVA